MKKLAIALAAVLGIGVVAAWAQSFLMPPPAGVVVLGCVYQSSPPTLTTGQTGFAQCDSTGHLSTGGGGIATTVDIDQTTSGSTNGVSIPPSSSAAIGLTPVVSASAEATHVLKAGAGNAYSVYATNLTANAGFLVLLNATSAPADGAITPLACAPISPNGATSINYAPAPPGVFSTGITAVLTGSTTCFTKTTTGGTAITGFISGSVK